ncbi:MAG TPA: FHA domain-containing protein [Actinomycetes bacterium]
MADSSRADDTPARDNGSSTSSDDTAHTGDVVPRPPALGIHSGGELHGRIFEIRPGTQAIGRQPHCELRIDDASVSRRHAVVVRDGDAVSIEDTGSTNGTSVNGEPLYEGRRWLYSGDLVRVGGIDLVYFAGSETPARRMALLQPPEEATSVRVGPLPASDETPPLEPAPPGTPPPGPPPKPESSPLMPPQLALSGAAASVTALLLSGLHVDRLGATIAAGLTAIITTFLQTRGRRQWLRVGGGAGLALVLAVTGISVPELALGHALTDPGRRTTFLPPRLTSRPTATATTGTTGTPSGPGISITPNPDDCGQVPVGQSVSCQTLMVHSTGTSPLRMDSIEPPSGSGANDFSLVPGTQNPCLGRELPPGDSCTIEVTFTPMLPEKSSVTITVHQNLPRPDTGTTVTLTGTGVAGSQGTAPTTT